MVPLLTVPVPVTFWKVGRAAAPFDVRTCPADPTDATFWNAPVAVVPAHNTE